MNANERPIELLTAKDIENQIIDDSFDVSILEEKPYTEKEFWYKYQRYADLLYAYARINIDDFMQGLTNEIRAMLGHMSEYRGNDGTLHKNELEKAYGHFRRFNLDVLKIICDEYDRWLSEKLYNLSQYDLRNVHKDFLKQYSMQYFQARNAYLQAQQQEKVGSDREVHKIIELYYVAVKKYILLKRFYEQYQKRINSKLRNQMVFNWGSRIIFIVGVIVTVVGYLIG